MALSVFDFYRKLDRELFENESCGRDALNSTVRRLKMELKEGPKSYKLTVEAPGIPKDEMKISFENGVLLVSAEHSEQKGEQRDEHILFSELSYGRFSRQVRLPKNVDASNITARCDNGLLSIEVPKTEKHQTKLIQIQ